MTAHRGRFIERVEHHDTLRVVRWLGLETGKSGSFECPACQAARRSTSNPNDRCLPAGVWTRSHDSRPGWRCYRPECDRHGSVADLVAAALGCKPGDPAAREWWASHTSDLEHIDTRPGRSEGRPPRRHSASVESPPKAPSRPPGAGEHWLQGTAAVTTSDAVCDYLKSRKIDPATVARSGLARVAGPPQAPRPPWLHSADGWPLMVARVNHTGSVASIQGRRIDGRRKRVKSMAPKGGYAAGGLVFADSRARAMLERGADGPPRAVLAVEGEIDFLTMACHYLDDGNAPAVLGTTSGGWSAELTERIPSGSIVLLGHDDDDTGDRYASQIERALSERCDVRRVRPQLEGDTHHSGRDATDIGADAMAELVSRALQDDHPTPPTSDDTHAAIADESPDMPRTEIDRAPFAPIDDSEPAPGRHAESRDLGKLAQEVKARAPAPAPEAPAADPAPAPADRPGPTLSESGQPYIVAVKGDTKNYMVLCRSGEYRSVERGNVGTILEREWPDTDGVSAFYLTKGERWAPKTGPMLFADYGLEASRATYSTIAGQEGYHPGPNGVGKLTIRVGRLRVKRAAYHADVAEWLSAVGGAREGTLRDWLATLDRFERPSAVLYLQGPASSGKSMLLDAVSLMFGEDRTTYASASGDFNASLLDNPVMTLEEGLRGASSDVFKDLTGCERHNIRIKFQPEATLTGALRGIIGTNGPNALDFSHENAGLESEIATGKRILHFDLSGAARDHLAERGGYDHTRDWVRHPDGSPGKLCEHILHLIRTRGPKVVPGKRFYVEGSGVGHLRRAARRDGLEASILAAIATLAAPGLDTPIPEMEAPASFLPGEILVDGKMLHKHWRTIEHQARTPRGNTLGTALRKLAEASAEALGYADGESQRRRVHGRRRYVYAIDPALVVDTARAQGLSDPDDVLRACGLPTSDE